MHSIDELKSFLLRGLRGRFFPQFLPILAFGLFLAGCNGEQPPTPPPPPVECGENEHPDAGACVCDVGFERDEAGACVEALPPPPPPPPGCGENERRDEAGACVCVQGHIRDPLGACARPQNYIPWSSRDEWARRVDFAYSVWRGDRDLSLILVKGRCYLAGGSKAVLDEDAAALEATIARMVIARDEGDALIHRIENEKHRFFDSGDPWVRSQVRKSRANEMVDALEFQTGIYGDISSRFEPVRGCDAIGCKIDRDPCP